MQLPPKPIQAESVTASGAGVACRAPITLEQRIGCFRKAIEANTKGPRNADDSLVEGRTYEDLLAHWRNSCQRLRGVSLQDANMSLTRIINSSGMMYHTASSDNVLTRENVSSPSVQSLVDQMLQQSQNLQTQHSQNLQTMLQQSQNLQTQLTQNLQTLVELQTLVAEQQVSKGVVKVQAPTRKKIAKHSPSQGSTEGGKRGGDIGGRGTIADASLQTHKKRKLQNKITAHMAQPPIARETRSSVRNAAGPASRVMELIKKAEAQKEAEGNGGGEI